jgi:G3E family GTPase
MMLGDAPTGVPVTILTGFLGAGKTTLLNRILRGDHGLRVAVLVNDFGAINIDAELVVGVDSDMVSLSNGCICCSIRDDLAEATKQLLERPEPPEYILIEASGVSDPVSVALTFSMAPMRNLVHLDSIVAVVDSEQTQQLTRTYWRYDQLIYEQIAAADIVVLNKIDLVDDAGRSDIRAWINKIVPRARVLETTHGDVPLRLVLGVGRYRMALEPASNGRHHNDHHHDHDHHHDSEFSTWSYESTEPLSLRAVKQALKTLPASIFRAKGVLYLADMPDSRAIVHVVGSRVTIMPGERWFSVPRRSRLVVIGTPGGFEPVELQRRFDACQGTGVRQALSQAWQWVRS